MGEKMEGKRTSRIKGILLKAKDEVRNPIFIIAFIIAYLLLESPVIVGVILYFTTKNHYWLGIATGWFTLTAPALPIPVIPISCVVGVVAVEISKKIKGKKNG